MTLLKINTSTIRRIFYKIEDKFRSPQKFPPDSQRETFEFPKEGYTTSVEMALNSRCTSDYNGNPKKFHWGMFDPTKKLSEAQIKKIVSHAKVPRFTDYRMNVKTTSNMLTFIIENQVSGIHRDWVMIESGMQQQAVGLVCAALGSGMVFKNMGQNGRTLSEAEHANIEIKIDAMKPSYGRSFWSSLPPAERKPWVQGNLPDPTRNGKELLISALAELKTLKKNSTTVKASTISQLLWAARGRTPHIYKSTEWGMTIPTWGGKQDISSIYLLINHKLYKFLNWYNNRPTQRIELVHEIGKKLSSEINNHIPSANCFIILVKNESQARSSWEVGYQLLNMMLQAHVLDISYEAILLNKAQKHVVQKSGLSDPAAVLALSSENFTPVNQIGYQPIQ